MKKLIFTSVNTKVTPEAIVNSENILGIDFPESYKRFLILENGGIPNFKTYNINGQETNVIDKFLSLEEVVDVSISNREDVPEIKDYGLEVIASTWVASVVCIGVSENNFGKIYQFEVAIDPILISDSFEEFLSELYND